jgi:hypothetical protein
MLAITPPSGATASLIRDTHLGSVAIDSIEHIESSLEMLYTQWKSGSLHNENPGNSNYFLNNNLSLMLHGTLAKLAKTWSPQNVWES